MPSMPRNLESVAGKAPSPMRVLVTGMLKRSATSLTSAEALEMMVPPPMSITGCCAPARTLAARFTCPLWPTRVGL